MTSTVDWIDAKRRGMALSAEAIRSLVAGFATGEIPDYQMSAWLMAVTLRGMDMHEIFALTDAMVASGDRLDLSSISGVKVDKHSTGGVGDKITIALVPMLAAAGVPIAKMSGHALGYTGGTLDKLESIPGFRSELAQDTIIDQVRRIGACICSQSDRLAPADRAIYSLRDVTATVESIPLIASSIMSKKIACGADAIVLDVKVGAGAFMKTLDDARALAATCIAIGTEYGKPVVAYITDMDQPLGREVGNYREVREVVDMLEGKRGGDGRLTALTAVLCRQALRLAGNDAVPDDLIASGAAAEKLREIVAAQGGRVEALTNSPLPSEENPVTADRSGFVQQIDAGMVAKAAFALGAGRATKADRIDPMAGVTLCKSVGEEVRAGDVLGVMHASTGRAPTRDASQALRDAFVIGDQVVAPAPIVRERIVAGGLSDCDLT